MSEPENPFAQRDEPALSAPSRSTYIAIGVAVVAVLAALLFLMLWADAKRKELGQTAALKGKLASTQAELARLQTESQTNLDLIASLKTQVADLLKEKEMAGQMARNLESEMRADLESKDITISNLKGRLTVTIVDRVMFDSGEAVLKPDGAAVMQKIAGLLAEHPKLKIHVIGHTDNVPIRSGVRFASNWELSTARALAAVHYLTERAGVDPRRVGAVGYGEFHPIADNSTAEGRAKNRRIAITILPEEFPASDTPAPADSAPASTPASL
jgi:chemotaxis protein MotB